jgi:hypothetical protein
VTAKRLMRLAIVGVVMSSQAHAAPVATVGWTATATGRPIPRWTTTVTNIVVGPPTWGYRIVSAWPTPSVDRIVISLATTCDLPKSSFSPIITPAKGPSQQYVLIYRKPSRIQTISIRCDAKHGVVTTSFEMMRVTLGVTKVLARSAAAIVDGPK